MRMANALSAGTKGAYDLCHREGPGKNSRHIDRRAFKMRELRGTGKVKVRLVPTSENEADMLTKPLDVSTFRIHRATMMNLLADPSVAHSLALLLREDVEM